MIETANSHTMMMSHAPNESKAAKQRRTSDGFATIDPKKLPGAFNDSKRV
jgi:hypothetical protein